MKNTRTARIISLVCILTLLFVSSLWAMPPVSADDGAPVSKVSSSLSLRVQAKASYLAQAGDRPQAQAALPGADEQVSAALTDMGRERIFIHFAERPTDAQLAELGSLGIAAYPDSWLPPAGASPSGFILADMPVDKLEALAARDFVVSLETAEELAYPQNDLGRQAMSVGDVWADGYDGTGVTVAVLDSGIDTSNPDFPALDTTNSKDYSAYPTLDDTITNTVTGHGTHVAGSVLGRGVNSTTYKGVAPGASLVFLKIGGDVSSSATSAAIVYAIRDAVDVYHADIITMSYGGWSTYHDGTDEECQAVDYAVSRGATVFMSAGNNGASKWHYSGTVGAFSTTADITITFGAGVPSHLTTDLVWFDGLGTHNSLSVQYYNSSYVLLATTTGGQSESPRGTESRETWLNSAVGTGTYFLRVQNTSASSQNFHIYYYGGSGSVTFTSPDQSYTIGCPAEADGAIAVGAYVSRGSWVNYKGTTYGWGYTVGDIAPFSSRGPRVDASTPGKPNIVAPGSMIISVRDSLYTPGNPSYDPGIIDNDGLNLNGSGPANYYVMQGTSMACPLAAGVAALLLDKTPTLTPAQVRHALEKAATDKGTAGRDNIYGYGLANAAAASEVGISLASYSDAAHTVPNDYFSYAPGLNTAYLYATGYLPSHDYRVAYYDDSGTKVATYVAATGAGGELASQHSFAYGTGVPGTWHAIVCEAQFTPPTAYNANWGYTIAADVFAVHMVTTEAATGITNTEATLHGTLTDMGGASSMSASFEYGITTGYGSTVVAVPPALTGTGTFSATVSGLTPGHAYHFRARADASGGTIIVSISGTDIGSFQLHITCNPAVLSFTGITPGTLGDSDITISANIDAPGSARISGFGVQNPTDGGTVATITYTAVGAPGTSSVIIGSSSFWDLNGVPLADCTVSCSPPASMDAGADMVFSTLMGPTGWLRVQTVPPVPTTIFLDGIARDAWGLNWVKLPAGSYSLSFSDVLSCATPTEVSVNQNGAGPVTQSLASPITIVDGQTTEVIASFSIMGNLHVVTSPPVPATIYSNGQPMDDWGFWSYLPPGDYTISFEPLDGFITPDPQVATVTSGNTTTVFGNYVAGQNTVTPTPHGWLRVQTVPAVPTTIFIDGLPRDAWGLNYVKLPPGSYTLSFSDVPSVKTPMEVSVRHNGGDPIVQPLSEPVTIVDGQITEVIVGFIFLGNLHVVTSPPVPATIFLNGHPMDDWGFWTYIEAGEYTVSFRAMPGLLTPPPIVVAVNPSATTEVIGDYNTGQTQTTQ